MNKALNLFNLKLTSTKYNDIIISIELLLNILCEITMLSLTELCGRMKFTKADLAGFWCKSSWNECNSMLPWTRTPTSSIQREELPQIYGKFIS